MVKTPCHPRVSRGQMTRGVHTRPALDGRAYPHRDLERPVHDLPADHREIDPGVEQG